MNKLTATLALSLTTAFLSLAACGSANSPERAIRPTPVPERRDDPPSDPSKNNGTPAPNEDSKMNRRITLHIGGHSFTAVLEDNATARAFASQLPMTLPMEDLNANEKFYYLASDLPTAPSRSGMIQRGDLMLYGANCVVLFYETFPTSYSYTRLGQVEAPDELASVLGRGNVSVRFELSPSTPQ